MDFVNELKWRGMLHDIMPGTEDLLKNDTVTAYVGIDPTADSLHVGHLVSVMMLKHLQQAGHKPLALVGGATGMIGDPSGKSEERKLLTPEVLLHNVAAIKKQLVKFLDFENGINKAELVNNYDWTKDYNMLDFLREIGKHLTINYMMAKDSVKNRLETGLSYTEFSYQLLQAYDFLFLYQNKNCRLQMGGSDQWGNITTGTELIRRKTGGEAYALTCPLITKADGKKFGKSEEGNIWLDPNLTSPYKFFQFWLNCSDEDSEKYIKIFTLLNKEVIDSLIEQHKQSPHLRLLQKTLAKEMTVFIHSKEDYDASVNASEILFGSGTLDHIKQIDEKTFLSVFEGVPHFVINYNDLENRINIIDFLAEKTQILSSKGEARRSLKENSISINKIKIKEEYNIGRDDLINNKYIIIQKGKKNFYLITAQ
ncbi:MAG: tyrosine--tRNA ligase [Bacteroidales bacterium]|nr:tyrosine--tRNA ligase [Bacteroidales bacterium]